MAANFGNKVAFKGATPWLSNPIKVYKSFMINLMYGQLWQLFLVGKNCHPLVLDCAWKWFIPKKSFTYQISWSRI